MPHLLCGYTAVSVMRARITGRQVRVIQEINLMVSKKVLKKPNGMLGDQSSETECLKGIFNTRVLHRENSKIQNTNIVLKVQNFPVLINRMLLMIILAENLNFEDVDQNW